MRRTSPLSRVLEIILLTFGTLIVTVLASSVVLARLTGTVWWLALLIPAFIAINIVPGLPRHFPKRSRTRNARLSVTHHGVEALRIFLWSSLLGAALHIYLAVTLLPEQWTTWAASLAACVAVEFVVFLNGIVSVYVSSTQLGVRQRVIGILLGWIPLVNVGALIWIIRTTAREVTTEQNKLLLDEQRRDLKVCNTRYPLLLVHGVFFRDTPLLNYWGRIPDELIANGAEVYYGNHESASSVQDAARELNERIKDIVATTGCSKVNVIAHSKGGLDVRWAASCLDAAPLIASITTINTPHRGCGFAEYLLEKIPVSQQESLASAYNAAALHAGDAHPDFLAAVHDLTTSRCEELTQRMDSEEALRRNDGNNGNNDGHIPYDDIFCQSVGSKLVRAASGKFPLNFTHPLVKWFDGPNDGLVSETSFSWGENYTFLTPTKHRGISHADMIDLDRENIPGFDVREFYVRLVSGLRERGL